MDNKSWVSFLNTKIRSQISLEAVDKAQSWGFAILAFLAVGLGLNTIEQTRGISFLFETKVLFIVLTHIILLFAFYLPLLLEKGGKPVSSMLCIRNISSLTLNLLMLTFTAVVINMISYQIIASGKEADAPGFFMFLAGTNMAVASFYLFAGIFFFLSLSFFPQILTRLFEKSSRVPHTFFGIHLTLAFLMGMSYTDAVGLGSQVFFEQLRVAGVFWIALLCGLFFIGRFLKESSIQALTDLELEVASGRLERNEDIIKRYKESFVSQRLWNWTHHLAGKVAQKAHDIAGHTHEALNTIGQKKPSEFDLRKVEEHYKKADSLYRKLELDNQRFLLAVSFFEVAEAEQEKVEELRDQFSRELRNSKLELASVRKRIDEKLVSLKNTQAPAEDVSVEKVPMTR